MRKLPLELSTAPGRAERVYKSLSAVSKKAISPDQAQRALAIAREVEDPAQLARALTACGYIAGYIDAQAARAYLAEAIGLARALGDRWRLSKPWRSRARSTTRPCSRGR